MDSAATVTIREQVPLWARMPPAISIWDMIQPAEDIAMEVGVGRHGEGLEDKFALGTIVGFHA